MSLLAELVHETTRLLNGIPGAREVEVPPAFAERTGRVGEDAVTMTSRAWTLPSIPWFRVAALEGGDRVRVYSALALPDPATTLPMFGAEVVEIRGRVTVVAIDWMPVAGELPGASALAAIRASFADMPPGGQLPEWAATAFSAHALFSRPEGSVPAERIIEALRAYLSGYLDRIGTAGTRTEPERARSAIAAYCREHFENDPGGRMLERMFGEAWATEYAEGFLFRVENEAQQVTR